MALSTYTELQAAVASWVNRSDLTTQIQDFIRIAEAEINDRVRVRQNQDTTTLTLSAGADTVALPSNFLEEIELNYTDQGRGLQRGSWNDIDRLRASDTAASRPELYGFAADSVVFERAADAAYSLTLRYFRKWDIATDLSNWLLTNRPDAYLFGAIHEVGLYLGDAEMASYSKAKRDAAIQSVLLADSRTKGGVLRTEFGGQGVFDIVTRS